MGSNLYRALLRGAPLSVPTGNTHAPGPSGMPTGCSRYLPPWPLCTMCAKKGVDNLLNYTLPLAGTSGSMKQVWGLLEQDSIYGRLRRLNHFLHDKHKKYISHQSDRITTHHTLPCPTGHNCLDEELETSSCLPKTETFPDSFR